MRSGYSNFSWLRRVARVVPLIAGAALLGGMIGGFAMFAIDSALTWEPASQTRSDARTDNQVNANAQPTPTTKPAPIVGGAIPDPSAGMSGPPPAQQPQRPQQTQQRTATPAQSAGQISPALLTPKPLGPAEQLQSQTATTRPSPGTPNSATQPQTPTANQPAAHTQDASQSDAAAQLQSRWPDALSHARQNAANAQQQTAPRAPSTPPAPSAQTGDHAANNNSQSAGKEANTDRTASTDDQARTDSSRRGRHSRRHASRSGGYDEASSAAASSRRQQDARSYDRLYDAYGERRDRSYGNAGQQVYGDRDDQSDAASRPDRYDARQYGRNRYGRSRLTREQPEPSDRSQSFQAGPRPEPFWGGGFFRRDYQDED